MDTPCQHDREWQISRVGWLDERMLKLLKDGWEPFAVQGDAYYFKRKEPCWRCKNEENIAKGWLKEIFHR